MRGLAPAAGLVLLAGCGPSHFACRITDAYEASAAVGRLPPEQRVASFHATVIAPYADLYAYETLGLRPGIELDAAIAAAVAKPRDEASRTRARDALRQSIDTTSRAMEKRFPGYGCLGTIYFADTLGQLDGADRRLASHGESLVFGIDVVADEQDRIELPVLVAHEMFHRYHASVAGFSDADSDRQALWKTLWAEGLATYASQDLTGATTPQALMLPADLEARASPLAPAIAQDLRAHLDRPDPELYRTYFTYGNHEVTARGLPWRSGYYVGYLVAKEIVRRHGLVEATRMRESSPVHDEIADVLLDIGARPR